jgi:hypothetical protein
MAKTRRAALPFEGDENSVIGESKHPQFFPRDPGAGQGPMV